MKAVVHVHQNEARQKDPANHPAIIVRTYKGSTRHTHIKINGPFELIHADHPDHCGATITGFCMFEDIEILEEV